MPFSDKGFELAALRFFAVGVPTHSGAHGREGFEDDVMMCYHYC